MSRHANPVIFGHENVHNSGFGSGYFCTVHGFICVADREYMYIPMNDEKPVLTLVCYNCIHDECMTGDAEEVP